MITLHIPEHSCDMQKMIVGIATQPKKGTTFFQCTICNKKWNESSTIVKTIRFEGITLYPRGEDQ